MQVFAKFKSILPKGLRATLKLKIRNLSILHVQIQAILLYLARSQSKGKELGPMAVQIKVISN